jgi:hypothetical protein
MKRRDRSFVSLAAIFFLTAIFFLAASSPAPAQDYAQQFNPGAVPQFNPRVLQPSSPCWKRVCAERFPRSAGALSGRCKRFVDVAVECGGPGRDFP